MCGRSAARGTRRLMAYACVRRLRAMPVRPICRSCLQHRSRQRCRTFWIRKFAAPVTTTLPNFLDPFRNINVLAIQNVVGNPDLTPEIARNTSFGVVLAEPSWLPNFSISVDYYKI